MTCSLQAKRDSVGFKLVTDELKKLYGKEPLLKRTGGSVNAFADFHEILGLESYSFGFGDSDGYIHAPDERFRLSRYCRFSFSHSYLPMFVIGIESIECANLADIYVHACSYISTYDSLHMGQDAYVSMILQAAETFGTTTKDEL